jgi:hypothetical protein
MNLQDVTRQEILTETLRVLNEIKLENLGFPQEIIDSIRTIPAKEVREELKPIEFENYVGWIGQLLKSPSGYLPGADYLNMYREEIKKFVLIVPIKSPDNEKFDNIPEEMLSKVVGEITDALAVTHSTFMSLLKVRKLVVSYANKFLPKYGVNLPEQQKEIMFEKLDFMIQAFMNDLKQGFVFTSLDTLILKDYRYFTTKFEKEQFGSIGQMRREADRILEQMEDDSKVMNVPGMPKDFYWYNIGLSSCSIESERMGHCGRDRGGILFSLRRKSGRELTSESHVTVSYNENTATVLQIKGKGNAVPLQKYWPMVAAFFKYVGAENNKENGRYSASGTDAFQEMNEYLEAETGVPSENAFAEVVKYAKERVRLLENPDYVPRYEGLTADVKLRQPDRNTLTFIGEISTSFSIVAGSYGNSSFMEMSDYADGELNEVIEQIQRGENYDLYQNTHIETEVFIGDKQDKREQLVFKTTFEYTLGDEDGDEGYWNTQVADYHLATKYLFGHSDYLDKAIEVLEGLYENDYLKQDEGFQPSIEQLEAKMNKNPHVILNKNASNVKVEIVQTRADGYAFRYDFDEYYDSLPPSRRGAQSPEQVASAVMERIKSTSDDIIKDFLSASEQLISNQLDLFRTGEPVDISAVLPFIKTNLVRIMADEGYTLKLSFVMDKAVSAEEIAQVTAITEFLSENYSYFVQHLDKVTDELLQRALRALEKQALKNPKRSAPTSYEIKSYLSE